jgi:hypothetical protein
MTSHCLRIHSLRDIIVSCSCGKWHYIGTTTSHDTDAELKQRIEEEYLKHCARHCIEALLNWE